MASHDPASASPPPPASCDPAAPAASRAFSIMKLAGAVFLISQVIFVLHTHFSENRQRLLTPVHGLTRYELHATSGQHQLNPDDIRNRYGIPAQGESSLAAETVHTVIHHREKPIPLSRALLVRLRTREPDGTEGYWLWPQE